MKKIIDWIKSHVWQSIVIGLVTVGVVTTSIVLPIVLSGEETTQQHGPGPTPESVYYTITVINDYTDHGYVELKANGQTVVSGSQILEHTEITVLIEYWNEGYLVSFKMNGSEVQDPSTPYTFTLESNTTLEFEFDGGSPTPQD